jgi:acetoacetyl-CoA synthetase
MSVEMPIWSPSPTRIAESNITAFCDYLRKTTGQFYTDYLSLHQWSVQQPEEFWSSVWDYFQVKGSKGDTPFLSKKEESIEGAQFFPNAKLNFAQNLLIKQDDSPAIIERNENGERRELSWKQLHDQVEALASQFRKQGIKSGDRISALMPNCIETLIGMLATTSLGAVWSSCSPDFGIQGVKDRFGQIKPRILIAANGYYYGGKTLDIVDKVLSITCELPALEQLIWVDFLDQSKADTGKSISDTHQQKLQFIHWDAYLDKAPTPLEYEQMPFNAPLYIMYSSGTTGVPKCIVHGIGGTLLQHLKELAFHSDVKPSDRLFYYTTCGWMMWNWLVSGLACGATLVLYDGSPFSPGPSSLWDMAEQENIAIFGASAKYYAACEKAGLNPIKSHKLSALRALLSTGSPLAHESFDYIYKQVKHDVCLSSISGGTDIISCFALGCPILPVYRGELQCMGLGMNVNFVPDEEARDNASDNRGELVCETPFPSMPIGFWNDQNGKKYHGAYFDRFAGIWAHGDFGETVYHAKTSDLPEQKGIIIHGRSDAVLNPGGVRIGTAEIYRQVEKLDEVLDSIAIGQNWEEDVRVVLFVKLREGINLDEALEKKIKNTIRQNTTPRHVPAKILTVTDIPRTISGKIVELAVRNVVHGLPVRNTDALANPDALGQFKNRKELLD